MRERKDGDTGRHEEHEGVSIPKGNQVTKLFNKQLSFLSYKFTFYRSGENGSYVARYITPVLSAWVERLNRIGTLWRSLGEGMKRGRLIVAMISVHEIPRESFGFNSVR